MLQIRINECQDCESLKSLLKQVDCSLQNLLRNKLNTEKYNVDLYFSTEKSKALYHYKRILTKKIFNPFYLNDIDSQDIIFQVKKILFGNCSTCIQCEDTTTTSSTTSTSTTTNIS